MNTLIKFLILIMCFGISKGNAQYIIAGAHNTNDFYHDINPDSIIYAPYIWSNPSLDSLLLDVNNDSIFDIKISAENIDGGNWYHYISCKIYPLYNNQIAIDYFDTCYANCPPPYFVYAVPMAKAFDVNDSISDGETWIDSAAYLTFQNWSANVPNGCGYGCYGATFALTPLYVGIKLPTNTDTLFGWIKVSGMYNLNDSLVVESFACNKIATAVNNIYLHSAISTYPNPSTDKLYIKIDSPLVSNFNVTMIDMLGKIHYKGIISSKISTIDLKTFQKGLFVLKMKSEKETLVFKIIVE